MRTIATMLLVALSMSAWSQTMNSIYPTDYSSRKKMPDQFVREADVMWSKTVWRLIDLKQKKNHHLYFPTQKRGKYMSLSDVLVDLVKTKGIGVYQENQGDEFGLMITRKEMEERMGKKGETIWVDNPVTAETTQRFIPGSYNTSDITRYLLKEVWFFDRNRGQMDVRIIGICPIIGYYRDEMEEELLYKKVGWFYFPEIEKHLVNYPAMNGTNEAWKWSYYDIMKNRYFSSIIVQVGNMYDDRAISEYATGQEALLESKRLEDEIRNFELDLWSY